VRDARLERRRRGAALGARLPRLERLAQRGFGVVREGRLLHVHRLDTQAEAAAQLDGRGGDRPSARGGGLDRALGAAGQLGGLGAERFGGSDEPERGALQVLRARRRGVRERSSAVCV
jgi:hypothetical protein